MNEAGRRGPPAAIEFTLAPRWFETTLFQGSAVALLLFGVLGAHRWRTGAISRSHRQLEAEMSQRRRAEVALREREAHYRRVFESSVNGFLVLDPEDKITDANGAAVDMFGYPRDSLLGRVASELFDRAGETTHPDHTIGVRRDGRRFEVRVGRRALGGDGGGQALLTVTDLSPLIEARIQEQRLQAQLAHSQRVEAIGRLAGGVAHDVNNMLTVVQGQARLAQEALDEDDRAGVEESLADILESSERTGNLTRQLLALGRRRHVQAVDLDIREHVTGMRRMLERLTPENVVLRWSWPEEPCVAHLDPTQLEQLVVNLIINAAQALPHGGTVEVGLALVRGEPSHLPPGAVGPGDWVNLSFEDDGPGMSEEVKSRIFEPFFSTKTQGENTGLGLSVVHGIVAEAGGRYFVESTEGVGTRFDLLFPARAPARPASGPRRQPLEGLSGSARILFVEDEAPVRRTTARLLERAGYEVTVCAHPFEALERLRSAEQPFDLLLTDVMMPDMNGRELSDAVRERAPDHRVLFVSGYTSDIMVDLDERQDFVEKPFEARELLRAVKKLLET